MNKKELEQERRMERFDRYRNLLEKDPLYKEAKEIEINNMCDKMEHIFLDGFEEGSSDGYDCGFSFGKIDGFRNAAILLSESGFDEVKIAETLKVDPVYVKAWLDRRSSYAVDSSRVDPIEVRHESIVNEELWDRIVSKRKR